MWKKNEIEIIPAREVYTYRVANNILCFLKKRFSEDRVVFITG